MSSAAKERSDIGRAEATVEKCREELADLEAQFESDRADLESAMSLDAVEIEALEVPPRKTDLNIEGPHFVWCPWLVSDTGERRPGWQIGGTA